MGAAEGEPSGVPQGKRKKKLVAIHTQAAAQVRQAERPVSILTQGQVTLTHLTHDSGPVLFGLRVLICTRVCTYNHNNIHLYIQTTVYISPIAIAPH